MSLEDELIDLLRQGVKLVSEDMMVDEEIDFGPAYGGACERRDQWLKDARKKLVDHTRKKLMRA
jgi:hypothetical protein